jgi:hypothetical protein
MFVAARPRFHARPDRGDPLTAAEVNPVDQILPGRSGLGELLVDVLPPLGLGAHLAPLSEEVVFEAVGSWQLAVWSWRRRVKRFRRSPTLSYSPTFREGNAAPCRRTLEISPAATGL